MPQTFNQNGHTFGTMWTLWSSWPFEKSQFLVMKVIFFIVQQNVYTIKCLFNIFMIITPCIEIILIY